MFVDEAKIWVKAGDGGHGCVSFRREKCIPKGGPDGGGGGDGGSVYFLATDDIDTLSDFAGKHHRQAQNGSPGEGKNKHGSDGQDLVVPVPTGTMVYDIDLDVLLKDLNRPGQKVCICRGGQGGKGNKAFATSTRQSPRFAQKGSPGQERNIRLELKLIADVGLVGMPNAGKSTLLSRCSAARPKIADYPFTTLNPVLGIVEMSGHRRFVMADIPGLIEGAHDGRGLGHEFLRHLERTKLVAHILEIMPPDDSDPLENYRKIRRELSLYSLALAEKPEVIVLNKTDLDGDGRTAERISRRLKRLFPGSAVKIAAISAVSGAGINKLNELLWKAVSKIVITEDLR